MSKAGDGTFLVGRPPVPCQCTHCEAVRNGWRLIDTAAKDQVGIFWIHAGNEFMDTSGNPIRSNRPPCLYFGKRGGWSSFMTATHWMPYPEPPTVSEL